MDVERGTVPRVSQWNLVGECVLCFQVEFLGVRIDNGEVGRIFSWTRPSEISSQRRSHEFVALGRTGGATVQGRLEVLGQSNKGFNIHGAMIRPSAHTAQAAFPTAAFPTAAVPNKHLRLAARGSGFVQCGQTGTCRAFYIQEWRRILADPVEGLRRYVLQPNAPNGVALMHNMPFGFLLRKPAAA